MIDLYGASIFLCKRKVEMINGLFGYFILLEKWTWKCRARTIDTRQRQFVVAMNRIVHVRSGHGLDMEAEVESVIAQVAPQTI